MKRRDFIKYSTLLGVISLFDAANTGCTELTPNLKPANFKIPDGSGLLLKNLNIIDVKEGKVIYPAHILIRGKRIEEIAYGNECPTCEIVLDLNGRYAMPGIINAHCHLTLPGAFGLRLKFLTSLRRQIERNAEECLRHGVTTVRDMLGFPSALDKLQREISDGKLLGPRILRNTAVQVDSGYGEALSMIGGKRMITGVNSPEEARKAVKFACHNNVDFIKTFLQYNQLWLPGKPLPVLDDDTLRAIVDEAEKHERPVALHHTSVEGFRRALKAGVPSLEHMAIDNILSEEDVELLLKSNAGIIPTASVAWALAFKRTGDPLSESKEVQELIEDRKERISAHLDEFAEPAVKEVALQYLKKFSDPEYFDESHLMLTPEPKFFNSAAVIGNRNLMQLVEAKALIGCGNDGGIPFVFPGSMTLEMGILQRLGIKPAEILKMATINNARILRMADRLGSIERNKIADIVILSDNPLVDITNTAKIEKVFFEGQLKYSV
jgi:imidazolonepropionase-like amidohydrolase